MNARIWSFVLQWSRVGIAAILFLVATRFLTLSEIGVFATAIAPIRLTQGLHKAGIGESVIILGTAARRLDALFALSVSVGLGLSLILAATGFAADLPLLTTLAAIPLMNGLAAVSEGLLRKHLALRALALRTLGVQSIAAALTLWLLIQGAGPWALAAFALLNTGLSGLVSIWLARWRPRTCPNWRYQSLIIAKPAQIAARDLLASAQFPLAQLAIGLMLGMPAAGAFQIAARMLNLIEALALSPLRFIALPQLRTATALSPALQQHLKLNATLAAWIWGGTFAAAPEILMLATGDTHAAATAPILRALALCGLLGALWMPVMQALTATGQTYLVLKNAGLTLGVATSLVIPTLFISPTLSAGAVSGATLVTSLWLLPRALSALNLTTRDLSPIVAPVTAGVLMTSALLCMPHLPLVLEVAVGTVLYGALLGLILAGKAAPRPRRNAA